MTRARSPDSYDEWIPLRIAADMLGLNDKKEIASLLAENKMDIPRHFAEETGQGMCLSVLAVLNLAILTGQFGAAQAILSKLCSASKSASTSALSSSQCNMLQ